MTFQPGSALQRRPGSALSPPICQKSPSKSLSFLVRSVRPENDRVKTKLEAAITRGELQGPEPHHTTPSISRQRRPLLVRASTLEAQRSSSFAERLKGQNSSSCLLSRVSHFRLSGKVAPVAGFGSQKRDSARYLAVDIVLQNPDKTLEFNRGAIYLIGGLNLARACLSCFSSLSPVRSVCGLALTSDLPAQMRKATSPSQRAFTK